jgi:type II secretory pathway pseudopilin PulG
MAALLVGLTIMALVMSAAGPVWQTAAKREREAELIFRGEQYARAIQLFQRKYANALPASVDTLVSERFLRRKYLDPITNAEFQLLDAAQAARLTSSADGRGSTTAGRSGGASTGQTELAGRTGGLPGAAGAGTARATAPTAGRGGGPGATQRPGQAGGGIVGVTSRSSAPSLREYRGRSVYNQWAFVPVERQFTAGGAGTPAPGVGGGRGTPTPGPTPSGANRGPGGSSFPPPPVRPR